MKERMMTEKQAKKHEERIREIRGRKGIKPPRVIRDRHCTKSKYDKGGIELDKIKEYETRFSNIWLAIKGLESRVIQLESKER